MQADEPAGDTIASLLRLTVRRTSMSDEATSRFPIERRAFHETGQNTDCMLRSDHPGFDDAVDNFGPCAIRATACNYS
jgi:hypothetical protein